jgi:hypothetical protein
MQLQNPSAHFTTLYVCIRCGAMLTIPPRAPSFSLGVSTPPPMMRFPLTRPAVAADRPKRRRKKR